MSKPTLRFSSVFFALFLLSVLLIPETVSLRLRSCAVASFFPVWKMGSGVQKYLSDRPIGRKIVQDQEKLLFLEFENRRLEAELEELVDWIFSLKKEEGNFFQKRLEAHYESIPAEVIYRDPSAWSSSIWINIGESANQKLSKNIVSKNSPVMKGGSLVGVVEYVGKEQSRVRLITDPCLALAVRAHRGNFQNRSLYAEVESLKELLKHRLDLFVSQEESERFFETFQELQRRLQVEKEDLFLAKGELRGSFSSLWRSGQLLLKGVGFNFDFPDEQGELGFEQKARLPILKEGDLLITSGLDGIFPPGLKVGYVTQVGKTRVKSSYEIEAYPAALDLNNLQLVTVLPPLHGE